MTLALPDTVLVRRALDVVRPALPVAIVEHSLRTFLIARAYGTAAGMAFDEEDLALASVFHDLGMAADRRARDVPFAVAGGLELARFLAEQEVPEPRITPLVDAIAFHMQLVPRWSKGPVAGLLQVGAWGDALRLGPFRIGRAEVRAIERAHPRTGFDLLFARSLLSTLTSFRACSGLLLPSRHIEEARAERGVAQ